MTDTEHLEKGVYTSKLRNSFINNFGRNPEATEENTMEDETSSNGLEFSPAGGERRKADPAAAGGGGGAEKKDPTGGADPSGGTDTSGEEKSDSNDANDGGGTGGTGASGTGAGGGASLQPPHTGGTNLGATGGANLGGTGATGGPNIPPVSDSNLIDEAIRLGLEVQKKVPESGREDLKAEYEVDKDRIMEDGANLSAENEAQYQNYDRMADAEAAYRHGLAPEVENEAERREAQSKEANELQAEHDALMDDRGGLVPVPNYREHVSEERMQGWGRALARFGAAGLKQGSNAIDAASKALGEFRKLTMAFLSPNPMSTASKVLASTMIGFSDLYDTIDKAGELAGIKQGADRSIVMETDKGRKYFVDKDKAEQATKYLMQTFNDQIAATVGPGGDVSQLTPKEYQRIHETMKEALTPMLDEIRKRSAAGIDPTLEERAVVQGWMNLEEGYKKAMREEQKDLRGIKSRAEGLDKDVNKLNREVAARDKVHNSADEWLTKQKFRNIKNYTKGEDQIKSRVSRELKRRESKYLSDLKKMESDLGKQEEYVAAYNEAVATGDTIGALVRITLDHDAAKAIRDKDGTVIKNTLMTAQDAANARTLAAKTPELKALWTNIARAFGRRIQEINNMGTGQRKMNRLLAPKKPNKPIKTPTDPVEQDYRERMSFKTVNNLINKVGFNNPQAYVNYVVDDAKTHYPWESSWNKDPEKVRLFEDLINTHREIAALQYDMLSMYKEGKMVANSPEHHEVAKYLRELDNKRGRIVRTLYPMGIPDRKVVTPPKAPGGAEIPLTSPIDVKGEETDLRGGQVIDPAAEAVDPTGEEPVSWTKGWTLHPAGEVYTKDDVNNAHEYLKKALGIGKFEFGNNKENSKKAKEIIKKMMGDISSKVGANKKVEPADIKALNDLYSAIYTMKIGAKKGRDRKSFNETLEDLKKLGENLKAASDSGDYDSFIPKEKKKGGSGGKKGDAKDVDDNFADLFNKEGKIKDPKSERALTYLDDNIKAAEAVLSDETTSDEEKNNQFNALNRIWKQYRDIPYTKWNKFNSRIAGLRRKVPKLETVPIKNSASFEELLKERISSKYQTRE